MHNSRDVDWSVLSSSPSPAYRQGRNVALGVNAGFFVLGVLVLNLTEGLALVVPVVLAGAWCLSLLTGGVLLVRRATRAVGRGVVVGTTWSLGAQVVFGVLLLGGWLSENGG